MRHDWISRGEYNESAYCLVCRNDRDEETPYDSECPGEMLWVNPLASRVATLEAEVAKLRQTLADSVDELDRYQPILTISGPEMEESYVGEYLLLSDVEKLLEVKP